MRRAVWVAAWLACASLGARAQEGGPWADDRAFLEQALVPGPTALPHGKEQTISAGDGPAGGLLTTVTVDALRIWSLEPEPRELARAPFRQAGVRAQYVIAREVAFAPSGRVVAVSVTHDRDLELQVWRLTADPPGLTLASCTPLALEVHFRGELRFTPDGKQLLAATAKGLARWTIGEDGALDEGTVAPGPEGLLRPGPLAISPDGRWALQVSERELFRWRLEPTPRAEPLDWQGGQVGQEVHFSRDGRDVLRVGNGVERAAFDPSTGQLGPPVELEGLNARCAVGSGWLAHVRMGVVRVLSLEKGAVSDRLALPVDGTSDRWLRATRVGLVTGDSRSCAVWEGDTGEPWRPLDPLRGRPRFDLRPAGEAVFPSVSGLALAPGTDPARARGIALGPKSTPFELDLVGGRVVQGGPLPGLDKEVTVAAVSSSGTWAALGLGTKDGEGSALSLWRLAPAGLEPREVQRLELAWAPRRLAFDPEERWIAAASERAVHLFRFDVAAEPPLQEVGQPVEHAARGTGRWPRLAAAPGLVWTTHGGQTRRLRAEDSGLVAAGQWTDTGADGGELAVRSGALFVSHGWSACRWFDLARAVEGQPWTPSAELEIPGQAQAVDLHPAGALAVMRLQYHDQVRLARAGRAGPTASAVIGRAGRTLWTAAFTGDGAAVVTLESAPDVSGRIRLWRLPAPQRVAIGADALEWGWDLGPPGEPARVTATWRAAGPELLLTVTHDGGGGAHLLRGRLQAGPGAEPAWVALGTLRPGQRIVRRLRLALPAGARPVLELADQEGRLPSLEVAPED